VSRYQLWRRRIAPVADVRALDADVFIGSDVIARFHKAALPGSAIGATKFEASLPAEDADVHIDVDLGARHVRVARRIHIVEGSTVTIPLADALGSESGNKSRSLSIGSSAPWTAPVRSRSPLADSGLRAS
jgi:hypothetical protein